MFELEKLLISHGHPIIKERIKHLVKLQYQSFDFSINDITSLNLFEHGTETIFDHDGFVYKLYFTNDKLIENNICEPRNDKNDQIKWDPTNFQRVFNTPFFLVIEVYNSRIKQLWSDAKQLVEHYRNMASSEIEIYEYQGVHGCLLVYIPSHVFSEFQPDVDNQNESSVAIEMVTSSIKNCLQCGSILNVIRYMSFYCLSDKKSISEEIIIEEYSLIYMTLLSNKRMHAFYPNSKDRNSFVILAIEILGQQEENNILTGNFVQELSNAISQNEIFALKNQLGFEMISISFSSSLPNNADKFLSSQKTDIASSDRSFLIFCIPISWLKSTDDYIKLHLAGFITIINNILMQVIPQCKSAIRCGLRKHVLELTNRECEGY
ncbi:hypothetical protein OJ253_2401 [Cryptosporidium canis]|uniref:Uncharacterized protein n=1 Tax=Cryptosporidium canis TaxID=195482 RepID=A0A9D5DLS1_9CRYT|nr:hypothetical protein OJ253_2401 [Cryptosporidium canis]